MNRLDIVIPVYNEGENIHGVLDSFVDHVSTPWRIYICYDHDDDDTLEALETYPKKDQADIVTVKNQGQGVFGAVMSGIDASDGPLVLTFPADDVLNAKNVSAMLAMASDGFDIVCASRFMEGGCMKGAPFIKALLVRIASFTMYHVARMPTRDSSNGLRMFSRRVFDHIPIESTEGWYFSIELLVKTHRLRWKIGEVPSQWYERTAGQSRFRVFKWLPGYLRWYFYSFATTWLFRGPSSVKTREPVAEPKAR